MQNSLDFSLGWREHSSSSSTECSMWQPCGLPCRGTYLTTWSTFCCITPSGVAPPPLSSKQLAASSSQAYVDLRCSSLKNKSKHRINVVKLHPRSFEAIILLDSTLRRMQKPSGPNYRFFICCSLLNESGLHVSSGMEQSVTSHFEA